ncbi:MAG TPA: RNA polymerase sigma factor [Candidatus Binatia bacterium]
MALRFEQLIERHHDEIYAYIWRLMGNDGRRDGATDVEDIVQEVFLRAYESFEGLRPNSNHRAWLYKIATNCVYTQLRRMKNQRDKLSSLKHSSPEPETASEVSSLHKHMEQTVRMLVNELPTKQKACVTLRYLQDLDYPEIAQILSCSQESARANVYQAIHRLRIAMEKKHDHA